MSKELKQENLFRMYHMGFSHFYSAVVLYQNLMNSMILWFEENRDFVLSMIPEATNNLLPGQHMSYEVPAHVAFMLYTQNMTNLEHIRTATTRLAIIQELLGFSLEIKMKHLICLKEKQIRRKWPCGGHQLLPLFNLLSRAKQLELEKLYRGCNVRPIIFNMRIKNKFSDSGEDNDVDTSKLPNILKMIDKYNMGYAKRYVEFDNDGQTSYWLSKELFMFFFELYPHFEINGCIRYQRFFVCS